MFEAVAVGRREDRTVIVRNIQARGRSLPPRNSSAFRHRHLNSDYARRSRLHRQLRLHRRHQRSPLRHLTSHCMEIIRIKMSIEIT